MAEDSVKALTPPIIDILDSKIRTMRGEFRRYPLLGLRSDWTIAKGLTTLSAACLLLGTTSTINIFVNQRHVDITSPAGITQPASVINTEAAPDTEVNSKRETLIIPESKPFGDIDQIVKDALDEEKLVRSVVDDARLKISDERKEFWVVRMLALIAIESEARIHASSGIAHGFTQISKDVVSDIIKKYQIPNFNIFNPWENTLVGLAHQLDLYDRYGDDLSLWAHHQGSGNMDQIILTHLKSLPNVPKNDSIFTKGISSNAQLRRYIEHYNITTEALLNNPAVLKKLDELGSNNDETLDYYPRYKIIENRISQSFQTKALSLFLYSSS